ncbi:hypothetical protein [Virgisporangium aurantiacum]|nr:hypothetical protein [Virgisporangium aurantiacum]
MNVRRLLQRAAIVVAVMAAVVATGGPANANVESGGTYPDPNKPAFCHYTIWDGTFYCNTEAEWFKPDYHWQVFVIGQDRSVYTRWRRDGGTAEWLNMGGTCNPNHRIFLNYQYANWSVVVNCIAAADGQWWYRKRFKDGSWTPRWIRGSASPDPL